MKKSTVLKSLPLLCFGLMFVPATILFRIGEIAVLGLAVCGVAMPLILYEPIKKLEKEEKNL